MRIALELPPPLSSLSRAMALTAGTRIGPFDVIDLVGAGGMGAVYRAYDPRLRREVAIKVLPPAFCGDPDRMRRFEQEALAETGNVILNSCLATIANSLESNLKMSLPEVLRGESMRFFNLPPPPAAGATVLFIYINFALRRRDIAGYIAMMMDMPSLAALKRLLRNLIGRTGGTSRA